jgi:hypothetical protein
MELELEQSGYDFAFVCLSSTDGSKMGVVLFLSWSGGLTLGGFVELWTYGVKLTGGLCGFHR